jgi:hypothetical protein
MSRSYLHPSQRPLKTEQIGPSSHKNEYHVGVLHGNWAEERNAFGRHANGPVRFEGASTTKNAYPAPSAGDIKAAQGPQLQMAGEAPRQLLFGHGQPHNSYLTTTEVSYPDSTKVDAGTLKTVKLPELAGVTKRTELSERKKAQWANETNIYVTTKNDTFDATANTIAASRPEEVYMPHRATHHGDFLHSLGASMRKTQLRDGR